MFIITNKNNLVLDYTDRITYADNGYPYIEEKNTCYAPEFFQVSEVAQLPEDFEFGKYCYTTEKNFYVNPKWSEPDASNIYGIPDALYHQIKDAAVDQIKEEVNANVNQ